MLIDPDNPAALFEVSSKAIIARKGADSYEFLLLKRVADRGGFFWDLPGGRLDSNDDLRIALERELREEIGQEVKITEALPIIGHTFWDPPVGERKLLLYQLIDCEKIEIDTENIVLSAEHSEARWFSEQEIRWVGDCHGAEMEAETSQTLQESLASLK